MGLDAKIYRNRKTSELFRRRATTNGVLRAFARILILFLMDEPFIALDPV